MVTNGNESRDTDGGEVEGDLRFTLAYLGVSSTALPYGDSKYSLMLEGIEVLFSPIPELEWAEPKASASEVSLECVLGADSRNSETPMLWNKLRDHCALWVSRHSEAGLLNPKRLTGRDG